MSIASGSIDLKSLKVAGEPNKYITTITNSGIKVQAQDATNYITIDASGMKVYKNGADDAIAHFGETVIIGNSEKSQIILLNDNIIGVGENGKSFFNFNGNGTAMRTSYKKTIYSDSMSMVPILDGELSYTIPYQNLNSVLVDFTCSSEQYGGQISGTGKIEFTIGVAETRTVQISGNPSNIEFSAYYDGISTISNIKANNHVSNYDVRISIEYITNTISPTYLLGDSSATGGYAIADGCETTAGGNYSQAHGYNTTTGSSAHCSFAGGSNTTVYGESAFAYGKGIILTRDYGAAIGCYNENNTSNWFEIGNGTDDNNRNNIFSVAYNGNVTANGNIKTGGSFLSPNNNALFPFTVQKQSITGISLAGTGDKSTSGTKTVTANDLCVVGYNISGTGATQISINRLYIDSGVIYYQMYNMSSTARSNITIDVYMLRKLT